MSACIVAMFVLRYSTTARKMNKFDGKCTPHILDVVFVNCCLRYPVTLVPWKYFYVVSSHLAGAIPHTLTTLIDFFSYMRKLSLHILYFGSVLQNDSLPR